MRLSKGLTILAFILATVGFVVALFLTVEHYRGLVPPCAVGGCETVTTSDYAVIFGIPVALVGTIGYLFMLALLVWYLDKKEERTLNIITAVTTMGALITLSLIALQLFVIKAICIYCMTTDLSMLGLFVIFFYDFVKRRSARRAGAVDNTKTLA